MKNVLITGGTGGIGTAFVKKFIGADYHAFITHNNKSDFALEEWLDHNNIVKQSITFLNINLIDFEKCNNEIEDLVARHDIDVLINNAGITADSSFIKMDWNQWSSVIDVNLKSLYCITQPVARSMVLRGEGQIINISSINGIKGQFGQTNYSASKAGIIGFTKSLAQELARKGVCVNAISPGYTLTPMVNKMSAKVLDTIKKSIPTQRLVHPSEIAKTALFIADNTGSLTWETISVNGGQHMY